ncbi:nucleoside recognition domain-containing protein [Feifania hominis]|uniref:Sporulation protein n=1 Tax=Feifania hominis TaxID=2763660 RepID=A0A926DBH3_9FIRM|nr:nucleoside recognition domain-containing protein [Feifania hominis]MBC8535478.1 sporulation protein [Feifania hominis]
MGFLIKKCFRFLLPAAILACIAALIRYPGEVSAAVIESLGVCFRVIIPALFPFFVFASLLIETGGARQLGTVFGFLMRPVFNVPKSCCLAFFLGILSGYPVGANTAISLYQSGYCTKTEAERLLSFCNNSGPAFVLGSVGIGIWKDFRLGVLLYVCHIAACVCTGFLFRFYKYGDRSRVPASRGSGSTARGLSGALTKSVRSSTDNLIYVIAFIVFFAVVTKLLTLSGVIPAVAAFFARVFSPAGLDAAFFENLLGGLLEVTAGVRGAGALTASAASRLALTAGILGWAGISVHCQVLSFLSESDLSSLPYIGGKAVQSVLASVFTYVALFFYPFEISVGKTLQSGVESILSVGFSDILLLSCALLIPAGIAWGIAAIVPRRQKSGLSKRAVLRYTKQEEHLGRTP